MQQLSGPLLEQNVVIFWAILGVFWTIQVAFVVGGETLWSENPFLRPKKLI